MPRILFALFSVLAVFFLGHVVLASPCTDRCVDKLYECRDRCGDESRTSSCWKKCEAREDRCLDACSDSSADDDDSAATSSTTIKEKDRDYCYEYNDEIEVYEYKAEKALYEKNYCAASPQLKRALSLLSRPPKECKEDGQWMSIFLSKIKRYEQQLDEAKARCEGSGAGHAGGDDIGIKKGNGGITLIQK